MGDLAAYEQKQSHLQVRAPEICPCCHKAGTLAKWGYYLRWVIGACATLDFRKIKVRRFLCRSCRHTISVLPGFAQPKHQMSNALIEDFMLSKATLQVERYEPIWKKMLRRLARFRDKLLRIVGFGLGRAPPVEAMTLDVLLWLWQSCGQDLNKATACLTKRFHCSVFGQYRCHEAAQIGE
jgi:hypothetical protein